MSVKAKWFLLGVLATVAAGLLEQHYKPCLEFLQHFIATGFTRL
jgi:hypothetical protein